MTKPDISVVIVSYNTKDLTLQTIQTLLDTTPLKLEIIVVDNNSTDGSADVIKTQFPDITVLAETKNHGFGGGNNLGAAQATTDLLAFINSDTIANATSLKPLVDYLKANPKCGIAAPKILLDDAATVQPFSFGAEPSVLSLLFREQQSLPATTEPLPVDWVTGAAFMIRRDLFEQLKGFDENIFMYFEDMDVCRRTRSAGYSVVLVPTATIVHLGGRSTASTRARKQRYYAAQTYYWQKHHGALSAVALRMLRLPLVLKSFLLP